MPDDEVMCRAHDLKPIYDVVIIGGGVHGLATAYYLAKRGLKNVAVLDKGHLGSGAGGRGSAVLRADLDAAELAAIYQESIKLFEKLAKELRYSFTFSQHGHLTLALNEPDLARLRQRAEIQRRIGGDSKMITRDEIAKLVPELHTTVRGKNILAGLHHPSGGFVRRDPVAWGFSCAADRLGVEIHPETEVASIRTANGSIQGVTTTRGAIATNTVVNAADAAVAKKAGIQLPAATVTLEELQTDRIKPFLQAIVSSESPGISIHQIESGEAIISTDTFKAHGLQPVDLPHLYQEAASHALALFPCLAQAKVLRRWQGQCESTPDGLPVVGPAAGLEGFFLNIGWGAHGFAAAPAAGLRLAEWIATGKTPEVLKPFGAARLAP